MHLRYVVCCCVVVASFSAAARAQEKAVTAPTKLAHETLGGSRYAVVIGVNDYRDEHIPDLRYAESDARAIYDTLTDPSIGGIAAEHATLLLGPDATTRGVRRALNDLRTIPADSTVFIFFSGHGAKEGGEGVTVVKIG